LDETKKIKGYHDEPLSGNRKGQNSIRLNQAYRAFYIISKDTKEIKIIEIIEVNKHEY
jgi:proteic killer suppression protein